MPNHVTTVIKADKAVIHALLTEEGVDFRRIIPTPEGYIGDDSCSHHHVSIFNPGPETEPLCWYVWNTDNWGTKWNAYRHEVRDNDSEVKFETAWNSPEPVIAALSRMFPAETLAVRYADEDKGYNLGEYDIRNGQVIRRRDFTFGDAEALDFACLLTEGMTHADYDKAWA